LDFEKVKKVIETMINDVFSKAANSESKKLLNELISYVHEVKPDLYTSFHRISHSFVSLKKILIKEYCLQNLSEYCLKEVRTKT
jgi:hypothetical protein